MIKTKIIRFSGRVTSPQVGVDRVHLFRRKTVPGDYHCRCRFCTKIIGELRRKDKTYYSRLDRRKYYDRCESGPKGHIAKTPLHLARWAVQQYTKVGDWVLDPTAGAGTTMVESLIQGRKAAGMELEFGEILKTNVGLFSAGRGIRAIVGEGDARNIRSFLRDIRRKYTLVVNNPPYFGDQTGKTAQYSRRLPGLGLLRENNEYWETISSIYSDCIHYLLPGGRFVVGVKDQMRQKKSDYLHRKFAVLLGDLGMKHEGTAFLKHYPGTLHLRTYFNFYGVHPPYYQTILVFRKER